MNESVRIKQAAIFHDGKIWEGRRHSDIIREIVAKTGARRIGQDEQGFVTECGKFVDREEAARIAFEAGQVSKLHKLLMSEDLY